MAGFDVSDKLDNVGTTEHLRWHKWHAGPMVKLFIRLAYDL